MDNGSVLMALRSHPVSNLSRDGSFSSEVETTFTSTTLRTFAPRLQNVRIPAVVREPRKQNGGFQEFGGRTAQEVRQCKAFCHLPSSPTQSYKKVPTRRGVSSISNVSIALNPGARCGNTVKVCPSTRWMTRCIAQRLFIHTSSLPGVCTIYACTGTSFSRSAELKHTLIPRPQYWSHTSTSSPCPTNILSSENENGRQPLGSLRSTVIYYSCLRFIAVHLRHRE